MDPVLGRPYTWARVTGWIRRKHRRMNWKELRRRYSGGGWWPAGGKVTLFNPGKVRTTRYRYRGAAIPPPGPSNHENATPGGLAEHHARRRCGV